MPFTVTVERVFSAAHAIRLPDGSVEPIHGHDFHLRVTVSRPQLDATGFVVDFHELERNVEAIVGPLRNRSLNETLPAALNPTAENLCWHVARTLVVPEGVSLRRVEVTEAPGCVACWEA